MQIQLSHIKNFQEQHSSVVVVPQGGLILLRELLAKIEKYPGLGQILWHRWTGFFATLCRLNFYDPVQNFNANIANYQVGLGIEFFAIHFPWKEADRKRNLTSVSIPKTNRMNHEFRPKIIVFFIDFFKKHVIKKKNNVWISIFAFWISVLGVLTRNSFNLQNLVVLIMWKYRCIKKTV